MSGYTSLIFSSFIVLYNIVEEIVLSKILCKNQIEDGLGLEDVTN